MRTARLLLPDAVAHGVVGRGGGWGGEEEKEWGEARRRWRERERVGEGGGETEEEEGVSTEEEEEASRCLSAPMRACWRACINKKLKKKEGRVWRSMSNAVAGKAN